MPTSTDRQLKVILFADIVGYTALMQKGEAKALSILERFQSQSLLLVQKHGGEIVKSYGDGSLILFSSTVNAVRCAIAMQQEFQVEPKVPLRIGVHVGEIVRRDKDIFGNGVNISSRIESMGTAGSVLLSKNAQEKVKNQEDIQMTSLGKFEFKNVEEPIEVFAIIQDGIITPQRKELRGKFKASKQKSNNKLIPILLAALAIFGLFGYFQYNKSLTVDKVDSSIVEDTKQKRVVVMPFENKTGDESLAQFGLMTSDWLTSGLMGLGEINMISAANIKKQIEQAGAVLSGNKEFVEATGIDILIQGRYYLQGDQISVQSNIINAIDGKVLNALTPISGTKEEINTLLNKLTQELMGYWAVKDQARFQQNPPNYKAYQEFQLGNQFYRSNPEKAVTHFRKASTIDPTFNAPLFRLITLFRNQGQDSLYHSIIKEVENKSAQLTQYDKINFEYLVASHKGDNLKAAEIAAQLYEMDKSSSRFNFNAGSRFIISKHPARGLKIMNDLDERFIKKDRAISWREGWMSGGYFQLKEFEKIIELAENYEFPKMYAELAADHIRALTRLGKWEQLEETVQDYLVNGVYDISGQKMENDYVYNIVCIELMIAHQPDLLEKYIAKLERWTEKHLNEENYSNNKGNIAWYRKDYQQAIEWWQQEKIDPNDWFNKMRWLSRLGACKAHIGEIEAAESFIEEIFEMGTNNPLALGAMYYCKAGIEATLGQKSTAVKSLEKSFKEGIPFNSSLFAADIFLQPLFGDKAFEEFVRPEG